MTLTWQYVQLCKHYTLQKRNKDGETVWRQLGNVHGIGALFAILVEEEAVVVFT